MISDFFPSCFPPWGPPSTWCRTSPLHFSSFFPNQPPSFHNLLAFFIHSGSALHSLPQIFWSLLFNVINVLQKEKVTLLYSTSNISQCYVAAWVGGNLGGEWIHVCMLSRFSRVRLFVILWTVAHKARLSMEIHQVRILEWVAMLSSRASSWPRDWTCIS